MQVYLCRGWGHKKTGRAYSLLWGWDCEKAVLKKVRQKRWFNWKIASENEILILASGKLSLFEEDRKFLP